MATPDDKAAALAVYTQDGTAAAAKAAGVHANTIRAWAREAGIVAPVPKNLAVANEERWEAQAARRAADIGEVADRALAHLAEKLELATPKDTAVILGILVDKAQLLSGGATMRTENVSKSELDRSIERLVEAHSVDA